MWCLHFFVVVLLTVTAYVEADNRVVCYYDNSAARREGQGKLTKPFLENALQFCTDLMYGFAGIGETSNKLVSLDEHLDITQNNYREITGLKRIYPGLKIYLSLGGGRDGKGDSTERSVKYRTILESSDTRAVFVNSVPTFLKTYGFDGLDLGWQFPETKPKKTQGSFKRFFISIKHKIVGESIIDDKASEHKEEFTALVRELKNKFLHEGLALTLTVLPNVNSSVYYDTKALSPNLDLVIVNAFDFFNPERNPKEADFPAPLFDVLDRRFGENVDHQINFWTHNGVNSNKVILGIPASGKAWKMTTDSGLTGVPPLTVDGPAEAGIYTNKPGILSYAEICLKLDNPRKLTQSAGTHLKKTGDPSKKHGVYAYRLPDNNGPGIWVGYDDIDTVEAKTTYAASRGLGGIALNDLSMDDFRGLCNGDKYPLLRAARSRL